MRTTLLSLLSLLSFPTLSHLLLTTQSENLKDCAANAGFELPAAVLAGLATNSSSASVVTAVSNAASRANVQVWAVAGKEQWTLVCMSLGIGIVGVIMATF